MHGDTYALPRKPTSLTESLSVQLLVNITQGASAVPECRARRPLCLCEARRVFVFSVECTLEQPKVIYYSRRYYIYTLGLDLLKVTE